jgi:hypothetical protein
MNLFEKLLIALLLISHFTHCDRTKEISVKESGLTQKNKERVDVTKKTLVQTVVLANEYMKKILLLERESVKIDKKTLTETKLQKAVDTSGKALSQTHRHQANGLSLILSQISHQKPVQTIAKGIVEIVKAYHIEHNINFNILVSEKLPKAVKEQLEQVYEAWHRETTTESLPLTTEILQEPSNESENGPEYKIHKPALIFIDPGKIEDFLKNAAIKFNAPTDSRCVLFIERQKGDKSIREMNFDVHNKVRSSYATGTSAGLIDIVYSEGSRLSLFTFTWFEPCGNTTLTLINEFNFETLQWSEKIEIGDKSTELSKCGLDVFLNGLGMTDVTLKYLEPQRKLMKIIGDRLNFTARIVEDEYVDFHIGFLMDLSHNLTEDGLSVTSPFTMGRLQIAISDAELYSSFEKILLPFDELTWYLLLGTFGIAFGVIFAVSLMRKRWRNVVYGEDVRRPAYNVLGTFFGIAQPRLPRTFFARAILIQFIWFCLIFRTAYQGVFFELFTTDMRKPQPRTFNELIERNYTIKGTKEDFLIIANSFKIDLFSDCNATLDQGCFFFLNVVEDFPLVKGKFKFFNDTYVMLVNICDTIRDSSSKTAFIGDLNFIETIRSQCHFEPSILEEVLYENVFGVSMLLEHYLTPYIANVTQRLIEAGIVQHWYDFFQFMLAKIALELEKKIPNVLTLDGLSFGFIIWLSACGAAIALFVAEIIWCRIVGKAKVGVHPLHEEIHVEAAIDEADETSESIHSSQEEDRVSVKSYGYLFGKEVVGPWDDTLVVEDLEF